MEKSECEYAAFRMFAFALGEIVCLKQEVESLKGKEYQRPSRMLVVSRELREDCAGGITRNYAVRIYARLEAGGFTTGSVSYQEIEVCQPPTETK